MTKKKDTEKNITTKGVISADYKIFVEDIKAKTATYDLKEAKK